MGMVDLTDRRHSMLELGSELSRELLPLSRLRPPWPLTLLTSVTRGPALSELLPEAVLWGPEPSLTCDKTGYAVYVCTLYGSLTSSLLSSSFSLTLFLLGTGGFTPPVLITPLTGLGDFKIPLGPLVSSVTLLLLLVCFSFGLSEPE